jgi:hypothetical protein
MTRQEEIKELESALRNVTNPFRDYDLETEAEIMIDDGWHKQIEAEWAMKNAPVVCYECSNCGADLPFGLLARYTPYCCKCGAKMTIEGEII